MLLLKLVSVVEIYIQSTPCLITSDIMLLSCVAKKYFILLVANFQCISVSIFVSMFEMKSDTSNEVMDVFNQLSLHRTFLQKYIIE